MGDRVHSHNSNCIYSVAKSNRDSIKFSLSIAEQRAVGFILAWSLAFLQKEKKRKGKEILNNDLAVLPSHGTFLKGGLTRVLGMVSVILHVM